MLISQEELMQYIDFDAQSKMEMARSGKRPRLRSALEEAALATLYLLVGLDEEKGAKVQQYIHPDQNQLTPGITAFLGALDAEPPLIEDALKEFEKFEPEEAAAVIKLMLNFK